jgi:hypothetical protein
LYLDGNGIADLPFDIFSSMPELFFISIVNNQLTRLDPQSFAAQTQLYCINLQNNRLTFLDDDVFAQQTELDTLDLSGNELTTLTAALFRNNGLLSTLALSRNNISAIPNILGTLLSNAYFWQLEMAGNPSTCRIVTPTFSHPHDLFVCQCAPGFVQTVNALCESESMYVVTPQWGSLRGRFELQGPADQFATQVDIPQITASFVWNGRDISPSDTSISLHWLPESNTSAIFSPYFNISIADWPTVCTDERFRCGDIMNPNAEGDGEDHPFTESADLPTRVEYNVIGVDGQVKRISTVVSLVYSAFNTRGTFDVAFGHRFADVAAALGRKPRRVRIQQGYNNIHTLPSGSNPKNATSGVALNPDVLRTVANVTANVNIPTSITFQLVDSTCIPASNLQIQRSVSSLAGTPDEWEVVVGGMDLQAAQMSECTAVLQAVDSVTNEILNVTKINATVADCFDGETTTEIASTSCSGHGRCNVDLAPHDGYFAGCDCDAGFIGARCDEELVICQPINNRKTALVRGQCKPFILNTNALGERNKRPEFVNSYTDPTTFKGSFIVGATYRIAALKLNTSSTVVSDGTLAKITYTLGQDAPPGFFVSSNNGEILAQFNQPGQYNVSLVAVDISGLDAVVEQMTFVAVPKPVFKLAVVPMSRTDRGPQFTDPDANTTDYVVKESYRIAPRQINAGATKVSSGLISNITYTLKGAPSSWFVSATTGEIFGLFPEPKVYSFSLLALDADQKVQTMEKFVFNVVTPRTFGTSLDWNPETMMNQTIQSRYELGKTFAIPGPILPRNKLFIHASENDYSAIGITYLLDCTPLPLPLAAAAPIVPVALDDTGFGPLQCPQFFVDTASGAMLVNMSFAGTFSVKLVAKDAAGRFADVKAWNFSALPKATTNDQKYGPNHEGCGRGTKVSGPDIFTSPFKCYCVGTGYEGANCQTPVKNAGKLSGLIGDAIAGTLLAAAIIAGLILYRRRSKLNAPHSFRRMVQSLTEAEMVSLEHFVKGQRRETGGAVDGGAMGGVSDNFDVELLGSGTSDDDELLLIDLDTSNANESLIPLMSLGLKPQQVLRVPIEIELSRLEIRSSIGKGLSGDVSRGLLRNGRFSGNAATTCAVKQPKRGSGPREKVALLQEAALMAQFEHHNVIRLLGVVTRNQRCMIVIELCDFGALCDLLSREALQPTNAYTIHVATVIEIAADVAQGMVYLSNQNFVHRDLASRNILYDQHQVCKVADFGLSRLLADSKHYYYIKHGGNSPLPLRWTAPEVLVKGKFSTKSDVWSFVQVLVL